MFEEVLHAMSQPGLDELTALVVRFRDERDWRQFHTTKDVAISLALEAAEVLELTQWQSDQDLQESSPEQQAHFAQELSDVLYWVLLLAHDLHIDLAVAFQTKLAENATKYPIEKARGSRRKYTDL